MSNIDYKTIKGKKVLLYSGGMDCYIINQLERPDVLLYINNHSNYSDMEVQHLMKLKELGVKWLDNLVIVNDFINMSDMERDDYIIPARNAYFILKAAEYGDEIIMGVTSGDRPTDKCLPFAKMMTDLLNHLYEPSRWLGEGRHLNVNFKYKKFSKQDLITALVTERKRQTPGLNDYMAKDLVVDELFEYSSSCYEPQGDLPCGICKSCLRKWLAILGATGIDTSCQFAKSPREYFTLERIDEWIQRESGPGNRGQESRETIAVLEKLKDGEF